MFHSFLDQAFTDSEGFRRWGWMVRGTFSSLAFPLPGLRLSHGSYHLPCSPAKKGHSAHALRSLAFLEGHKDLSSSCLNPGYHIPYSSVPETGTFQRHGLTGKGWPSSPILVEVLNLFYLLLWLTSPALLLGLAHTYAQSLSICICLCHGIIWFYTT